MRIPGGSGAAPPGDPEQVSAVAQVDQPEDVVVAGAREPRAGHRRLPSRALVDRMLVLVALAAVAAVLLVRATGEHRRPDPAVPAGPSGPGAVAALPAPESPAAALARMIFVARSRTALQDNIRGAGTTPSCPQPPLRFDPVTAVMTAVRDVIAHATLLDASATMNADATLCGIDVRARQPDGATLVVFVVAPPFGTGHGFQISHPQPTGSRAEEVAVVRAGWQVEVGWLGPNADAPRLTQLASIAAEALRW